jgi:PAS domain S-box-containing protein
MSEVVRDNPISAEFRRDETRSRVVVYVVLAVALFVLYFLVRDSSWRGTKELHTLMEVVATLLAAIVGGLALVRYYSRKSTTLLFIGAGFLGTAFLDGYHALVTASVFATSLPSSLSSLISWSWIASRLFLSVLLWLSWVAWRREVRFGPRARIGETAVYSWTALLTVASFLFFAFVPLPRAYYPELVFHRPEEFVPALFFGLALVGYLRKGAWRYDTFEHWLVLSLIVGVIGQAVFMSCSGHLFDMMFDAAHALKKVTYILVLAGLTISMFFLFRRVEESAEALGHAEARTRAVIDGAVDGIITIDAGGIIEMFNPAAERTFGYTADEVIGRNVKVLMPAPYHDRHDGYLRNFLDTGEKKVIGLGREVSGLRRDGSVFPLDLAVSEVRIAGRRTFVGIIRDITERKLAEQALREKTAQVTLLHAVAAAANEATSVDQAIQACLDKVCAHTGWPVGHAYVLAANTRDRLVPTSLWHLDEPERFAAFRQITEATEFTTGVDLLGRVLVQRRPEWIPDVTREPVFVRAKEADELGVRACFVMPVMVGTDVVAALEFFSLDVIECDETLLQLMSHVGTQVGRVIERGQIEKMKNEFISIVSHELRTPLTSIQGALSLIVRMKPAGLSEKFANLISIAHKNCGRLVRLINDILDIEKIESGKMEFERVSQEVMPLIRQAIEANREYARQFSVSLALTRELPGIHADMESDRILRVLTNLISNAAKFSPEGGTVDVSVDRRGDHVRIEVTDHGEGIPEEFRAGIFGRFAQADSSATRKREGTGLGLSIAKAIIEKHDGTIGFETETDVGTTFFFELPEFRAESNGGSAETGKPGQFRVLICEDDRDIATVLRTMLENSGMRCDVAHSVAAAREFLADNDYSAMTLDLVLPDTDGLTFMRELRSEASTRDLPIVVVSARAEAGRQEINGDAVGIHDWISKPVDSDRLLDAVRRSSLSSRMGNRRILHVEDDPDVVTLISAMLGDAAEVASVATLEEARSVLRRETFDMVLLDIGLPDGSGLDLLPEMRAPDGTPVPVVLFTAHDVPGEIARNVEAVLIKSRTSGDLLMQTLASIMGYGKPRENTGATGSG